MLMVYVYGFDRGKYNCKWDIFVVDTFHEVRSKRERRKEVCIPHMHC